MASLLRPFIIGLILFLSILNQIETRIAQNDDDVSKLRINRQEYNPYPYDHRQRYPEPPSGQYPSRDPSETYVQNSECKGCGPRRDCQCPGKGAMGITGPQGFPGIPGDRGLKGPSGRSGYPGVSGEKGDRGQYGNKGERGDDGLLPIDGQNGFPGQAGAVGPRGIPGVPGCNGSKGEPGDDGRMGLDGLPGASGTPGRAGDIVSRFFFLVPGSPR
ncbi:unnamed protein product [Rotaria sordida]|uniref:Uncharacterized protein n=1 Tax=Rotaria sordida TaxID=392033 RepID=A0A814Q6J1_9BILA|nr:unnamed protein product [Rotaria sordida]